MSDDPFERLPRREETQQVPQPVEGEHGLFVVDATFGKIAPISLHPKVRTVGELEVIEHLRAGGRAVDTRQPEHLEHGTLPGAVGVVHEQIVERREEFDDGSSEVVFFCNGPSCTATPSAIARLLDDGFPPERILYYRGGARDWLTLGLPLSPA
jgi:rhodanese-related sulfurtransferase